MSVVDIPRRGQPRYKDADPPQQVHLTAKVHSQCSSYCQGEIVSFLVLFSGIPSLPMQVLECGIENSTNFRKDSVSQH